LFCGDEVIGGAKKLREFSSGEGIAGLQADPLGSRKIGRGYDARALCELGEIFGRDLEGEPNRGWLERGDSEHFSGDLK
jgi:hypothetical protein